MEEMKHQEVVIREFDQQKDTPQVEDVERRCEVGPPGKMSLFTNLLGDPICRIRNSSSYLMLVAEMGPDKKIVGMIRGCIKTITCGRKISRYARNYSIPTEHPKLTPILTKAGYILGLRVCPSHRRMGIGLKLVRQMETWFTKNGAEYSYIATESDNKASLDLFTHKCNYIKFRTPSILVHPVFAHNVKLSNRVSIFKPNPLEAETLYRHWFATTEFFPGDIERILNNNLSIGTYIAVPADMYRNGYWPGADRFLADPPESWAIMSVWNSRELFTLQVKGASVTQRLAVKSTRVVDRVLPWLRVPSVPNLFRPFGLAFVYGIGGEGPRAGKLMRVLCGHAHNLARKMGCGVVVTEVAQEEPLRSGIPHWKRLSCDEDVWCIKRLVKDYIDGYVGDWTKCPPSESIFVDPREF